MGAFVRGPDGKSFVAPFWGGQGSWIDFTMPAAREVVEGAHEGEPP